jgi:predicted acetyltransferase
MRPAARASYGPPAGPAEFRALEGILQHVYQFEKGGFRRWARKAGRENVRVVRGGGAVAGGLVLYRMGLWFGGRPVPTLGVAGVGVAPESRAAGVGSGMMRAVVREAAARGIALSGLYPATQPVYRQAGYEHAGHRIVHALPASAFDAREREPALRPIRPGDRAAVRALYRDLCRTSAGLVERTPFLWERLTSPPGGTHRGWLVADRGRPVGYVYAAPRKVENLHQDLALTDLAFATPEAGRRILAFVASQRSFVKTVRWNGGPGDALAALLREQEVTVERHWKWMARICDLPAAVAARGYAPSVAAEVALDVEDPLVPANAGRWILRVREGRGRAVRGGPGTIRVSVGTLASLYTGYASAEEAVRTGRIEGPGVSLGALSSVFAGPAPWNREMY